jgi:hypothetical protein
LYFAFVGEKYQQRRKITFSSTVKKEAKISKDTIETHYASESMLAKNWLTHISFYNTKAKWVNSKLPSFLII